MASSTMRLAALLLLASSSTTAQTTTTVPYKSCAVPSFDWATYSTSTTARMYGMRGTYSSGYIYAAGFVKSTIDASTPEGVATKGKFALTGPYSRADPSGSDSVTITEDLISYTTAQGAKENAGGTWGQYEVGVVKINAVTGKPEDLFVWEGHGLDETTGVAAKDGTLAVSGHFTGELTATLSDGTTKTILNSNIDEGGFANNTDQFHPNTKDASGDSGVDDGFVIKASAETGVADWIVHYPKSDKDAQIIDVDIDANGNVIGAGYSCMLDSVTDVKICEGVVALFAGADGELLWEKKLPQLGAVLRISYDESSAAVYATGTTTFSGMTNKGDANSANPLCAHDTCSVVLQISMVDASVGWERTLQGSPRWGVFGQNGGITVDVDGPFIYAAVDDTGETNSTTIAGSPYAVCMSDESTAALTQFEYEISTSKLVTAEDCPEGTTYYGRDTPQASQPPKPFADVQCGNSKSGLACVMKLHKFTGLPMWAHDTPEVSGIVAVPGGVSIGGWYSSRGGIPTFGTVQMPGYLREQGLDGKSGGVYNVKIDSEGVGEYAISSGGGTKDRLNDMVGDDEGNLYNIGYHQNLKMTWGADLATVMVEDDGESALNSDNPTSAVETQICVSKLMADTTATQPSCFTSCSGSTDDAVIAADQCYIDGKCYGTGDFTTSFGKSCFVCDPTASQTEWSEGPTIGAAGGDCVINGACVPAGQLYYYQRRAWNSPKVMSECRVCDPGASVSDWSVADGYTYNATTPIPPADCVKDAEVIDTPVPAPTEGVSKVVEEKDSSGMSTGAIVGIVLGVFVVGGAISYGFMMYSKGSNNKEFEQPYNTREPDDKSSIASGV